MGEKFEFEDSLYTDGFLIEDCVGNEILKESKEEALKEIERLNIMYKFNNDLLTQDLPKETWEDSDYTYKYTTEELGEEENSSGSQLKKLLDSGKDFDTGWGLSGKEFTSLRVCRKGSKIVIFVHNEMDDIPEIIYDAVEDGQEDLLTEEAVEDIENLLYECMDFATEVDLDKVLSADISFEKLMEEIAELEKESYDDLEDKFEFCKGTVKGYFENQE